MTEGLFRNLFRKQSYKELYENLSKVMLFQGFTRKEILLLIPILHFRKYKAGEIIFKKGQPSHGIFVIYKGEVSIFDKRKKLALLKNCEFFGEISLVGDYSRNASAQAVKDSTMVYISKEELMDFIMKKPGAGVKMLLNISKVLGSRLTYMNETLAKLSK